MAMEADEDSVLDEYIKREDKLIAPKIVPTGPVKEVIQKGDDVDLYQLPITHHNEKDSGDFITAGITVVKDPDTGVYNAGIYRMMRIDKKTLGMSYEKHTHIGYIHRKLMKLNKPLECITFIGHHPACILGSQSKVAMDVSEYDVIGSLMQQPLEVTQGETVDLLVPAWAEVVIEGIIPPDRVEPEGPFGEYTWYYGLERPSPVMEVTAVTYRKDAYFHDLFAAHVEHNIAGQLGRESVLYKRVKALVPSVRKVAMPISGLCRFHAYVQIAKEYDGEGKLAALAALASDSFVKLAVIVDKDVDITNDSEVWWALATRTQPDRSTFFVPEVAGSRLDPASYSIWNRNEKDSLITKWAIDATRPIEAPFEERADVPGEIWEKMDLADYIQGWKK
jgi:2,5-furandicarboxylate decarboxylase 1